MSAQEGVFRAYDIRGIVEKDFDAAWVEGLGRACGAYFLERGQTSAVVGTIAATLLRYFTAR